ncbi:MAG: CheR family methyltransferase, partial [Elusimicrobiota bacterium]
MKNPSGREPNSKQPQRRRTGAGPAERFLLVGVGASAGGLDAVGGLIGPFTPDAPLSFILIQHLEPDQQDVLADVLSRRTRLTVCAARRGRRIKPGHVYVVPPDCQLSLRKGRLEVSPFSGTGPCMPVDHFFRSLAADRGPSAAGVILSGQGTDGALGLKAVKDEGGITFVQEPSSALCDGMPKSAAEAGGADFVLPVAGIVKELARIARYPLEPDTRLPAGWEDETMKRIFSLIRAAAGVDFSEYKSPTIQRRILRRMALLKMAKPADYVRHIEKHPEEAQALCQDILIRVTRFFRDPETFAALGRRVFPEVLKHRAPEDPARIWVPGCSTGEEVYSIAMTLLEFLGEKISQVPVQIFGTDVNESALQKARAGVYLPNIAQDVSPERLQRFFYKSDGKFIINKTIRDMCIFSRQDVTKDPPFSKLDIISCRNLLIYLGQDLQNKIFSIFHYALKPSGFLVLGASETIHTFSDRFSTVDKKNNVYCKRLVPSRPHLAFHSRARETAAAEKTHAGKKKAGPASWSEFDMQREVDRILLNKYAPASVLAGEDMEILQTRGKVSAYLELAPGKASLNLMRMVREGLLVDLRAAVEKARKTGLPSRRTGLQVRSQGQFKDVDVEVVPVSSPFHKEHYFLVIFRDAAPPAPSKAPAGPATRRRSESRRIVQLQRELAVTKDYMQKVIEEQGVTNEELKAANEETLSTNEELQSTNEELET